MGAMIQKCSTPGQGRRAIFGSAERGCWQAIFVLLACAACGGIANSAERPNILLVVADDATWRDFGFTGNQEVKTPNLDQLATEGMQLTHMFTPAPSCSSARHSLYTGLYPTRSGGYPSHTRVLEGTLTLFGHFKQRGYRVALQGKEHVGPDSSFPYEYLGNTIKDDFNPTRNFITRDGDQPWLLVFASNNPHSPWDSGKKGLHDPAKLTIPPYLHDNPTTRRMLADYYGEINKLDWQVGALMKLLDETGQTKNTLVMFVSEQGSRFPYGGKWSLYDNGIRIATIARWPEKVKPGSTSDAFVQYVDVAPTFLAAMGTDPTQIDVGRPDANGATGFDGRSFFDVLTGKSDKMRDYVFAQHTTISALKEHYRMRAVRDARYKYIRNLAPQNTYKIDGLHSGEPLESWIADAKDDPELAARIDWLFHRPAEELYDLHSDEYEIKNLATDPALSEIKARLAAELDNWMAQQGDLGMDTALKTNAPRSGKRGAKKGAKNKRNAADK